MELLINTKPNLAHCRDRKGNNLLHIAAKNRNQHFFEFIIKRTGPQALKGRNNVPL
jgi:ankyrin repeat protein